MATPNTITPAIECRMLELQDRGVRLRDIARELGVDASTVCRRLRSLRNAGQWDREDMQERHGGDGAPLDLDAVLQDFADWIGSDAEAAARSRPRRGETYDAERDSRRGSEGYLEGSSI